VEKGSADLHDDTPEEATHDVAAADVGGENAVRDEVHHGADVVADHLNAECRHDKVSGSEIRATHHLLVRSKTTKT
jgi:hypothetical protein